MGLRLEVKGDWKKTFAFLNKNKTLNVDYVLNQIAILGVEALQQYTPKDTGRASFSWIYTIEKKRTTTSIVWNNLDLENGYNVAILVQYGHGTKGGTYVQGVDYINPALKPIFEKLADDIWKEVTS